jgi:hypothetical protein
VIRRLVTIALALAFLPPLTARGEATVSFPLGEHYRIGRYVPVRVTGVNPGATPLRLHAEGAVTTEVTASAGQVNATVPLLAVTRLDELQWSAADADHPSAQNFRALGDDERLVGAADPDESLASQLFPGKRIHTVRLDLADPLPGSATAWGALDAVLLDAAAAARVTEQQVATLLAAGTAVAIRSDARPGGPWPWERRGPWWVVRLDLAGPRGVIEPDAYAPVAGRAVGWPRSFRRQLTFALIAFAIAAVAASLWKSKWTWAAVVLICVGATAVVVMSRQDQVPIRTTDAAVLVRANGWGQDDEWSYYTAVVPGESTMTPAPGELIRPIFSSNRHFQTTNIALDCDGDGAPMRFRFSLRRDQSIAFLRRVMHLRGPRSSKDYRETTSPLTAVVEHLYLSAGDRIVANTGIGSMGPAGERWPDVIVERGVPLTPTPAPATSPAAPPR